MIKVLKEGTCWRYGVMSRVVSIHGVETDEEEMAVLEKARLHNERVASKRRGVAKVKKVTELTNVTKEDEMGLLDVAQGHKPIDNDEGKKFQGDAVVKINSITSKKTKNDEDMVVLEMEVTRAIPDAKGRETNVVYGDKITKFYFDGARGKGKDLEAFFDDMHTSGIEMSTDSEEMLALSFSDAVNKPMYLRCFIGSFQDKETGETVEYSKVNVKNKSLLTDELLTPEIPC